MFAPSGYPQEHLSMICQHPSCGSSDKVMHFDIAIISMGMMRLFLCALHRVQLEMTLNRNEQKEAA